jgi:hypothetical protein
MAGLVPAIHVFLCRRAPESKTWIPATPQSLMDAGKIKPIALMTQDRPPFALSDWPTLFEMGFREPRVSSLSVPPYNAPTDFQRA